MKEKLKRLYDDYIGWIIIIVIIFPFGILLDIKFIEMLRKLRKRQSK